jgi:hypothetical protein
VAGLSSDPVKRRRQLEALARGSEKRAATLRARLAEMDDPPATPVPSAAPTPVAAPQPPTGVRAGTYSDAPSAAASEAEPEAPEVEPSPAASEAASEADDPPAPSRGVTLAARLLRVDR